MKPVLFFFVVWLILMLMLSSCVTSQNKCQDFGMNVEYVDVYAKSVDNEKLQVVKYRCVPKKSKL